MLSDIELLMKSMAVNKSYDSNLIEFCIENFMGIVQNGQDYKLLESQEKRRIRSILIASAELICCEEGAQNVSVGKDCKLLLLAEWCIKVGVLQNLPSAEH